MHDCVIESAVVMQANVGEVSTASVACGVLGVGGNKGGVAVSFTLFRRRLCCVSSHFAAHQVLLLTTCGLVIPVKHVEEQQSASYASPDHTGAVTVLDMTHRPLLHQ